MLRQILSVFFAPATVLYAPITKNGSEANCRCGDSIDAHHVSTDDKKRHLWFLDHTLILGVSQERELDAWNPARGKGGAAVWDLDLTPVTKGWFRFPPRRFFCNLREARLKVVAFRTHAGLHTAKECWQTAKEKGQRKLGCVSVALGDERFALVDDIFIEKQMQFGEDYGFNQVWTGPDMSERIRAAKGQRCSTLRVKLEVNDQVTWDVDQVKLDPIIVDERRLMLLWSLVLGAVVGGLFSWVISRLVG
jgi:hypothetical protein